MSFNCIRPGTTLYQVQVTGHKAMEVMRRLLPQMGERRSERIRELLAAGVTRFRDADS